MWSPAARSARPNPTASASSSRPSTASPPNGERTTAGSVGWVIETSGGRAGLGQVTARRLATDPADVLLVLEDDAERLVDELRGQLARAERQQGRGPIERLGDAGDLRQVGLAEAVDEV